MTTETQTKNYIDPSEFFQEVLRCLRKDEISDKLGHMFLKLSEKYCNSPKFVRYTHIRDDLIATGAVASCKAFTKFKPYKKLGILIKNSLVKQIKPPKDDRDKELSGFWFRFKLDGDDVIFSYDNLSDMIERLDKLIDEFEDDGGTLMDWEGEEIEYDYKTCNNVFAFFTTVIHNSCIQFLKTEYNQKNIYNKMKLEHGLEADFGYTEMIREQEINSDDLEDPPPTEEEEEIIGWE